MADLDRLGDYVGKYVAITEPNGEGMKGIVMRVYKMEEHNGLAGRWVDVGYGYSWFVSGETSIEEVEYPS